MERSASLSGRRLEGADETEAVAEVGAAEEEAKAVTPRRSAAGVEVAMEEAD